MSDSDYLESVEPSQNFIEIPAVRPTALVSWWAASAFLGRFNTGVHRATYTTDRLKSVSLWVTGWTGGINGGPKFHNNIITRSVQLENLSGNNSKVVFEFEVVNGPVEVGYHTIDCFTDEP